MLLECVPNFSEGRRPEVIKAITEVIEAVPGVRLLDVDPGFATNRTVVTFVGEPEAVIEAAFQAIVKASEVIDMRQHQGEHARMGATDVCPLIPVSGMTMDDAVHYAQLLGQRVGEAGIPVYMYEYAATRPERSNLANIRAGEYEGLAQKMQQPDWKPDFGPETFNAKAGASVIGARDFLVAYNINLNTRSTRLANAIAFDVREAGRIKREGHPVLGEVVKDENGEPIRIPGTLKSVKAVGWYIPEYERAQISMNLTNIQVTPVHVAFDEVVKKATERGVRVTGSELVGLVPLNCLLEAGRHYLKLQGRSAGVSEETLISTAVQSLGLAELAPFDPHKKIIEYFLQQPSDSRLVNMTLREFANETASESPAPGGGSIAAYVGSLGAALTGMVANLSAGKRGWEERIEQMSDIAEHCQALKDQLLKEVDEDTRSFDAVMAGFGLPKNTDEEKKARTAAIQAATWYATQVPLQVMKTAAQVLPFAEQMVVEGNPNSVTDAAVGALCARTAIQGAFLNVKINAAGLKDRNQAAAILEEAAQIMEKAMTAEARILELVASKM